MFASIASGLGIVSRRASTIPSKDSGRMHAAQRSSLSEHANAHDDTDGGSSSGGGGGGEAGRPQLMQMEGWMQKEGSVFKTWKKRYFRLNGLFLAYYTSEDEVKGLIFLEGAISREGGLVIDSSTGQANYASGAAATPANASGNNGAAGRPASSSVSSSSSSAAAAPPSSPTGDQSERIYYLYLDPNKDDPALAAQQRREWMQTITNNVSYAARLRNWYAEREEKQKLLVEKLKAQVEAVRAEREMERFQAASSAKEAEAAAVEAALKAKHAEADAAAADPSHHRKKSALNGSSAAAAPGGIEFDPLSEDGGASAPIEAADALARDAAQRAADATLIGGENLDVPLLIAALKRKNQALEQDVRMILGENSSLKAAAAKAMEQARQEVEDEHAALDERAEELTRMEVAAMEARNKAEHSMANSAATIAALQAQIAALQSSPSSSSSSAQPSQLRPPGALLISSSSSVEEIMAQASTPHPTNNAGPGAAVPGMMSPSPSFSIQPSASSSGGFGGAGAAGGKSAAAPSSPHTTVLPDGSAPCSCTCVPPCVPFSAHKNTLRALDGLENKYASAVMDRAASENKQEKLRTEKKVLKQEVIRLRMMLQQAEQESAKPAAGAAPSPK